MLILLIPKSPPLSLRVCVFVCLCSAVQEHGARRVNSGLQALLSYGSGEGSEGRLAEETA